MTNDDDYWRGVVRDMKTICDAAIARAEKAEAGVGELRQLALDAFDAIYWIGGLDEVYVRDDGTSFTLRPLYWRLDPLSDLMRATEPKAKEQRQ